MSSTGLGTKGSIKNTDGTSLVVQWLRIHLPIQGTQVRSLVQELRSHMPQYNWAPESQLPSPAHLEPVLLNKRSPHNEKPVHPSWRNPAHSNKDTVLPKIKIKKLSIYRQVDRGRGRLLRLGRWAHGRSSNAVFQEREGGCPGAAVGVSGWRLVTRWGVPPLYQSKLWLDTPGAHSSFSAL